MHSVWCELNAGHTVINIIPSVKFSNNSIGVMDEN